MITKSGGNDFSGSFRTTFTNDGWKALTPYPGDANIDQVVPAYEMTFGGPILKDKLWFFTSGRFQNEQDQHHDALHRVQLHVRDRRQARPKGSSPTR